MSPTARLLNLMSLLQTGRDWPGSLLAERLGISRRTVRRDVERLRELGYTVTGVLGPDGGYRLDPGTRLPPLLFDEEQAVALGVALRTATLSGVGIEEAALRALTTVQQVMPSRLRSRLEALSFAAIPRSGAPTASADQLVALSTAVRARELIRFDYADAAAEVAAEGPRRAEPHELVARNGRWYLLGWDLGAEDWRVYRVDRIALRNPTGRRFTPRGLPGGDAAAYVEARFRGADEKNVWPCRGTVVIHLPANEVRPYAGDWTVEALGPDRCRCTLGSWSWIALAAQLNLFDAGVDIVGPDELREAFATLARRNASAASPAR